MILGIDASNIRGGGGVTHLVELLTAAEPEQHGFDKVVVWGGEETLHKLPERAWLTKVNPPALNRGLLRRTLWQRFHLSPFAGEAQCDVLFVLGGSFAGSFRPIVTMSQNLLPFEWSELRRYGWSLTTLKLLLLRYTQTWSFRSADGVIFLTGYARQAVEKVTGKIPGRTVLIPHGLDTRFQNHPRSQWPISDYTTSNPFRVLYVSIVDRYKYQWQVVEAVAQLRQETGYPMALDLVGPAYQPVMRQLQRHMKMRDPGQQWVRYHGAIPYQDLPALYAQADIGMFASSCETFGIILIEKMAAGLPIACSNRGPMPEILGDAGVYFDPENPQSIASALKKYVLSPTLRQEMAQASFDKAQHYSWRVCTDKTFAFLADIARARHS